MTFHVADSSAAVNKNMFLLRYKHNELDLLMIITIQLKFFLALFVCRLMKGKLKCLQLKDGVSFWREVLDAWVCPFQFDSSYPSLTLLPVTWRLMSL